MTVSGTNLAWAGFPSGASFTSLLLLLSGAGQEGPQESGAQTSLHPAAPASAREA